MSQRGSVGVCEQGYDFAHLVEFALRDLDREEHMRVAAHLPTCRACAGTFAEALATVGPPSARRPAGGDHDAGWSRVFSLPWVGRTARWSAAAAVVAGVAAAAVATVDWLRRPTFVTSSPAAARTVGEAAATGLRFGGTGIPDEHYILATTTYLRDEKSTGTVLLVRSSPGHEHDLCAFDEHGGPLWVASRDWPAGLFDAALRGDRLTFPPLAMTCVVTRREGAQMVETVGVVFNGGRRSGLLLVDPLAGRLRGTAFHDGPWTVDPSGQRPFLAPLPASEGTERNLLLAGAHEVAEGRRACLTVVTTSGACRTHVLLPSMPLEVSSADPSTRSVAHLFVDWEAGDTGLVQAMTVDGIVVRIPVRDGSLVLPAAEAMIGDGAKRAYNLTQRDPEAFSDFLRKRAGGGSDTEAAERAFADELRASIVETAPRLPTGWVDR